MSNSSMILLDTDNHIFIGHTYTDLTQQLLEHLKPGFTDVTRI